MLPSTIFLTSINFIIDVVLIVTYKGQHFSSKNFILIVINVISFVALTFLGGKNLIELIFKEVARISIY